MSDIKNETEKLREYGRWLDAAAGEYLQRKEEGADPGGVRVTTSSRWSTRAFATVAAAVLLLVGSFVVNHIGGRSGPRDVAFAWSAVPVDATSEQSRAVISACAQNTPVINNGPGTDAVVDIRGWLGIAVFVTGKSVTVCAAELRSDSPGSQVLEGLDLPMAGTSSGSSDIAGVQVANMHVSGREVTVVWGRDTELPDDCRNLDVFTSKGVIRALRSHGIFAFWYPGQPSISGLNANSIQYGCAADAGSPGAPSSTIAGADSFANLCIATQSVLMEHGVIDQSGRVVDLGKWDVGVHDAFVRRLTPIAEVFNPGPGMPLTDVYAAWTGVREGEMLYLDSTGAQLITDRPAVVSEVTKAIGRFNRVCEGSRTPPAERPVTVTPTTIRVREMTPVTPTTVLPG